MDLLFMIIAATLYASGIVCSIIGSKRRSFIYIALGINFLTLPLAFFIGLMGTDAPNSDFTNFLFGFFFIQTIPLLLLIISLLIKIIRRH